MGDPLSVVGSVVGLVSLGIQVTQSLVSFYASYKTQDSDLLHTRESLEILLDTFNSLSNTLSTRKFAVDELSLVKRIERSINSCEDLVKELDDECQI